LLEEIIAILSWASIPSSTKALLIASACSQKISEEMLSHFPLYFVLNDFASFDLGSGEIYHL